MERAMRAQSFYKKATLFSAAFVLAVSSLTAGVPFILSQRVGALPVAGTYQVTGNTTNAENTEGWMFNRDATNTTPIQFIHGESSTGTGALYVEPLSDSVAAKKFIGENFIFTQINQLSSISVDYKLGPLTNANQVYMNVYANYAASPDTYYYDCRYDVIASVGSTASYSTLTFNPNASYSVATRAGSASCPSSPSAMGEGAKIRAYAISLGDTSLNDADMSAYFDNAVVATNAGSVVYNFEGALVDTSTTQFVNDPKYVRVNNGSDVGAQIVTPDTTTDVRFYLNGNTATPYAGVNIGGAGATTSWWRLVTPLPAGEYTVSAEIFVAGAWWPVTDTAQLYSIDTPIAQYILPTALSNTFRPSDNPVRLKIDDQYEQFSRVRITVGGNTHEVTRTQCDLRAAGDYVLCDVASSSTWSPLASGTYTAPVATIYTKANNRLDNFTGQSFQIDGTAPVISSFSAPNTPVKSGFVVSATAEDIESGVESVNFYIVNLREDGACTGNGAKLFEQRVVGASGGVYSTAVNTTLDGEYCLVAVARNNAMGNSTSARQKVVIDTKDPVVEINNLTIENKLLGFDLNATDSASGLEIVSANIYNQANTGTPVIRLGKNSNGGTTGTTRLNEPYSGLAVGTKNFAMTISDVDVSTLPTGTYTIRAFARDHVGLEHRFLLVRFDIDNTAPNATVESATYLTTDGAQVIRGTAEAGAKVSLFIDDMVTPVTADIVADQAGNWSYALLSPRGEGVYDLAVIAEDAAGNRSAQSAMGPTLTVAIPGTSTPTNPGTGGPIINPGTGNPDPDVNGNEEQDTEGGSAVLPVPAQTNGGFPLANIGGGFQFQQVLGDSTETEEDANGANESGEPAVEGAATDNIVGQAVDSDSNQGRFMGLAWYWWLLIIAGVALIGWWIAAAIRRRSAEN